MTIVTLRMILLFCCASTYQLSQMQSFIPYYPTIDPCCYHYPFMLLILVVCSSFNLLSLTHSIIQPSVTGEFITQLIG
jgi:hypothetical protein